MDRKHEIFRAKCTAKQQFCIIDCDLHLVETSGQQAAYLEDCNNHTGKCIGMLLDKLLK